MSLHSMCFSPDGRRLATGTGGGEILIGDLETAREVLVLKAGGAVGSVRFHPSGDSLLSITDLGTAHLWRAPSWDEIAAAEKQTKGKTQW
jgi:WD40 repeat protein